MLMVYCVIYYLDAISSATASRMRQDIFCILLVTVLVYDAVYAHAGNETAIACTAGTFSAGETANITCYFQRNISAEDRHIFVGWKPFNASGGSKERRALACFKTSSQGLTCTADHEFYFNEKISDRLTLMIRKVSPRLAGSYTCRQIPQLNETTVPCQLRIEGASGQNRRELNRTTAIAISALVSGAGAAILSSIICIVIRRKKCKESGTSARQPLLGEDASGNGGETSDRAVSGDDQEPSTPETNIPV